MDYFSYDFLQAYMSEEQLLKSIWLLDHSQYWHIDN